MGAHAKYDLKVHIVWVPKYRKRILTGPVAVRTRDLLRQIATENDVHIISGKVKRRHGLTRCRYKGDNGMKRWVGLGIIADNLINIGNALAKQANPSGP